MSTDHEDTAFHGPVDLAAHRARRTARAGRAAPLLSFGRRRETPDERAERIANRLDPVQPLTPFERALSALAWFGTPVFTVIAIVVAFACGYGTCRLFH